MQDIIPAIKKEFFAYRNGIIADALRSSGDPHSFIMGCQLVDVVAITSRYEQSPELAQALWNDRKHRECRMAATMLYPIDMIDEETALKWAQDVECNEIADVLCHRLLRRLPYASSLAMTLLNNAEDNSRMAYTGLRLLLNLLIMGKVDNHDEIARVVARIRSTDPSKDIVRLLDSIEEELG